MEKIKIKLHTTQGGVNFYVNEDDAGMDLRAGEDAIIPAKSTGLVKTGIWTVIPSGYEVQIRSRSGMALKQNVFVLNSPGTIDAGYRGEWGIILCNLGDEDFVIKNGDRIAQAVLKEVIQIEWDVVASLEDLENSDRGDGGFGSTGKA